MADPYGGRVPVCLRCHGRDVRSQTIGDGLFPGGGEGMAWVCDTCGYIGQPLLVDPKDTGSATAGPDAAPVLGPLPDAPRPPDRVLGFFLLAAAFVWLFMGGVFGLGAMGDGGISGAITAVAIFALAAAFGFAFGKAGWQRVRPN